VRVLALAPGRGTITIFPGSVMGDPSLQIEHGTALDVLDSIRMVDKVMSHILVIVIVVRYSVCGSTELNVHNNCGRCLLCMMYKQETR
jgi:hypothetical protein